MRKIKIFSESSYQVIELQVNAWLANHKTAIIHDMLQSDFQIQDGSRSLTITIFYYEGNDNAVSND